MSVLAIRRLFLCASSRVLVTASRSPSRPSDHAILRHCSQKASKERLLSGDTETDPFFNPYSVYDQSALQASTGKIYDKKPFKYLCTEGETYRWCSCGYSKSQPFCDDMCKVAQMKIAERPVTFKAPATRHYWFCNCKQTGRRPFCDGSHRSERVQSAIK